MFSEANYNRLPARQTRELRRAPDLSPVEFPWRRAKFPRGRWDPIPWGMVPVVPRLDLLLVGSEERKPSNLAAQLNRIVAVEAF